MHDFSLSADTPEEEKVKKAVETFFKGFHARNSVVIKSVLAEEVVEQTMGKAKSGEVQLHREDIHNVRC